MTQGDCRRPHHRRICRDTVWARCCVRRRRRARHQHRRSRVFPEQQLSDGVHSTRHRYVRGQRTRPACGFVVGVVRRQHAVDQHLDLVIDDRGCTTSRTDQTPSRHPPGRRQRGERRTHSPAAMPRFRHIATVSQQTGSASRAIGPFQDESRVSRSGTGSVLPLNYVVSSIISRSPLTRAHASGAARAAPITPAARVVAATSGSPPCSRL